MISGLRAAAARRLAISALRAGPCGPVALRNGAAAPVRNAPAGAAPAEPIIFLIFIMCGGRERPPYRARGTGNFPANHARRTPLPGGMYASPTNIRYRVHKPKNVTIGRTGTAGSRPRPTERGKRAVIPQPLRGAHPCREACMPPTNIAVLPVAGPAWCLPCIVGRGLGPAAPMIF